MVLLFLASIHTVILILLAFLKHDLIYLNFFNILDLEQFFPGIDQGSTSFILSGVVIAIIFSAAYLISQKKKS